jgi:hypothetical protein
VATITVIPTRSCDHLSCFWLGKSIPHDASVEGIGRPLEPLGIATGSSLE